MWKLFLAILLFLLVVTIYYYPKCISNILKNHISICTSDSFCGLRDQHCNCNGWETMVGAREPYELTDNILSKVTFGA